MTFNVHGFNPITIEEAPQAQERVAKFAAALGAQIVGIQECRNDNRVTSAFNTHGYAPKNTVDVNLFSGTCGNAMFAKRKPIKAHVVNLSAEHERRCALLAAFDYDGHRLNVATLHLDAFEQTGRVRQKEVEQLLAFFAGNPEWTTNLVIMGDFNETNRDRMEESTDRQAAWDRTQQYFHINPKSRMDPMATLLAPKTGLCDARAVLSLPPHTYTHWSGQAIDHVLVRDLRDFTLVATDVLCSTLSDHRPLFCDLLPNWKTTKTDSEPSCDSMEKCKLD